MSTNLTARQKRALSALTEGATIEAAGTQAGVSRQTIHTWLAQDDFRTELSRAGGAALAAASMALLSATGDAVQVFVDALDPHAVVTRGRVLAAKTLLDMAIRYRDAGAIEERIAALEAALREIHEHAAR
jgi:hypothetical protein